ncbi:AlbA family DNA-binding domain-containing protein [Jiulongibacter sp. NS-SX5]|uniref:AlbA family DNA-binding domain-containing protein n=1 Tax=Jiulongibacter sp. NS-SX5 TaxID=3463854 RepID=UPI0040589112
MNARELGRLVAEGEGQKLEFKLKSNHPHKIIREMVAFANSDGGKLLVGVADNKELRGLKYADEDEYVLVKEIEKSIDPPISYDVERVYLDDGNSILVFDIPQGEDRPYGVIDGDEQRKIYVRVDDRSIQASKEVREILKGKTKAKSLRFGYGDKETALMKHLAIHETITVEDFSKLVDIPRKSASRTLVLLVLTQVLGFQPKEGGDLYYAL